MLAFFSVAKRGRLHWLLAYGKLLSTQEDVRFVTFGLIQSVLQVAHMAVGQRGDGVNDV